MKKIISIALLVVPGMAFAQSAPITNVNTLTNSVLGIFNIIIYVLVALAVVFIVYNVVMYIVKGNDPEGKKAALSSVGWGLVGLAVIVSIWGLVGILTRSFQTVPATNAIPNVSNSTGVGGLPGNQVPQLP